MFFIESIGLGNSAYCCKFLLVYLLMLAAILVSLCCCADDVVVVSMLQLDLVVDILLLVPFLGTVTFLAAFGSYLCFWWCCYCC